MEFKLNMNMKKEEKFDNKVDRFKKSFKFYKTINQTNVDAKILFNSELLKDSIDAVGHVHCKTFFGLKSSHTWKIHRLKFPDGLIFIQNPFTTEGQKYWISKCVVDYPRRPHITNIENLELLKREKIDTTGNSPVSIKVEEKSPSCSSLITSEDNSDVISFYKKLRWVTFGYHHNWDTKTYSDNFKCDFPEDLAEMIKYISLVLGFQYFEAEASIVNYYSLDSTLSGHQDTSEKNQEAPLFSISFGQSAIFLIGGESKEIEPVPIYLKSGDIVVMSGKSRLSYHGVPRIIKAKCLPWMGDYCSPNENYEGEETIHHTSRRYCSDLSFDKASQAECVVCDFVGRSTISQDACTVVSKWNEFLQNYICRCRINLNVRQVSYPRELELQHR